MDASSNPPWVVRYHLLLPAMSVREAPAVERGLVFYCLEERARRRVRFPCSSDPKKINTRVRLAH